MKRSVISAIALAGFLGIFVLPATALAAPDCTCRYDGGEVAEGQTACIKGPKGMTMARCEKVLNNTSWKMLNQPCPQSAVPQSPRRLAAAEAPKTLIR